MGLLAAEKKETSKHSGVIALFDRDFVKKGLFSKDFSRWLHAAFDMRQRSDYAAGHTVLFGTWPGDPEDGFEKMVEGLRKCDLIGGNLGIDC
jgi:hypothetical protein